MISLLKELSKEEVWRGFFENKKEKGHLAKFEEAALQKFIEEKRYIPVAAKIADGGFCFDPPVKKLVNKIGTAKKRTVYSYGYDETFVLKLLTHLLYKYDGYFSPNCFSFRKHTGVKAAINSLVSKKNIDKFYCYKLDIKNYFNSIVIEQLLPMLGDVFADDPALLAFFREMLTRDECVFSGKPQKEKRGVMAGTPTSPFLSNVFLTVLDRYFFENKILYARYSDDIIVFAPSEEELAEHKEYISAALAARNLEINRDKEQTFLPGQPWPFLGVEYNSGEIDLSPASIKKIKDKIRRKARALLRWKNKKNLPPEKAQTALINRFNKKFFYETDPNDLNWSRWFFPLLTTDKGLKEVDAYMQQQLRFLATGRHNKSNFEKAPYETLKSLGYISLVNKYHKYIDKTLSD